MKTIPCLTLTQPWATLIAVGAKHIETRSWRTFYHGPLAIHAAKYRSNAEIHDTVMRREFYRALLNESRGLVAIPSGAVVAICQLVGCYRTEQLLRWEGAHVLTEQERAFGDYSPGRWGWLLEDIRVLEEPIPAKGALGLWRWDVPEWWEQEA